MSGRSWKQLLIFYSWLTLLFLLLGFFFQLTAYDSNVLTCASFVLFFISYQELCDVCF